MARALMAVRCMLAWHSARGLSSPTRRCGILSSRRSILSYMPCVFVEGNRVPGLRGFERKPKGPLKYPVLDFRGHPVLTYSNEF